MINQTTLRHAYKSMMFVVRECNLEVDNKFYDLENEFLENFDDSETDLLDNLEQIYKLIQK